ncbi:alpha/beta hydrolase [Metabacillus halosaccharovorans]|uniref:alpha/beta hydrolase n=1 Tax=Metabacillus halosaccharovorans TaxID=930124 RepID=UPI0034CEF8CD
MMNNELHPVLSGAESLFFKGNETGIVLCHGFNGTPQSMAYIGENLAKYGYTVSIPRLKGHGTHVKDMESSTYEEWIENLQNAHETLKQTCERVYIVGQSMGGALTLQVAFRQYVDGIFLINAAVTDVAYNEYRYENTLSMIEEGNPDIKKHAVHEITYDQVPLKAIHQLLDLMDHTKNKLKHISIPTIIFKSKIDHVVSPTNSDYIYNNISSSEKWLIELKNSYHVASMDYDAPFIVDNIHESITNLNKNRPFQIMSSSSV